MPKRVNMHEAKSQLSRLVAEALGGEDVVIARAGQPLVRLVPVARDDVEAGKRPFGSLPIDTPDHVWFDPLSDEELSAWDQ